MKFPELQSEIKEDISINFVVVNKSSEYKQTDLVLGVANALQKW